LKFFGTAPAEYLEKKYVVKITAFDGYKSNFTTFTIDFKHQDPVVDKSKNSFESQLTS